MGTPSTTLASHALASEELRGRTLEVRCDAGLLWVTVEGAPDDVLLRAGECVMLSGRGLVVIEALERAEFAMVPKAA
ncbi:MAG: DUF2917 domain-containing protein [Polyangiaceae bacterium]|nr:DUF2917 domain-containing protein [Polyangiaceae bacterium]